MAIDVRAAARAVRAGDAAALRAALDEKPELAAKPALLMDAARFAHETLVGLLLERGADANARYRGYRPLHALIQERPHGELTEVPAVRLRCLRLLLDAGADPALPAAYPPAPALPVAAFTGLVPFVEALLAAGAPVDGFADAALGRREAVEARLARDPGFAGTRDRGALTALQCAAASRLGHGDAKLARALVDIARALLDAGADPAVRTRAWSHDVDTAYFAASSGQLDTFRLLLERGAEPTAALPSAVWNASGPFIDLALARGASIDRARSGGRPLLNDLVRWGKIEKALGLLARGADPNVAADDGWTAVHQAASRGNARMLMALLEAGGDPARPDRSGCTPLDVARESRRKRIVELLRC